jgi:hypothetical protein
LTIHGSAAFSPPHFGHDVGGALVEGYSGDRDLRQAEVHARSQLFVLAVFSASVENSGSPHRRGDWTKQSDMDGSADILPIERGGQVRVLGDGDAAVSGFRDHRSPNLAPPLGHNMRARSFRPAGSEAPRYVADTQRQRSHGVARCAPPPMSLRRRLLFVADVRIALHVLVLPLGHCAI